MKELIDEVYAEIKRLKNHDWAGVEYQKHLFKKLIAALEAAEAKFEEARADNYRMAMEMAELLCERKELRARVAELEAQVPKWVPVCDIKEIDDAPILAYRDDGVMYTTRKSVVIRTNAASVPSRGHRAVYTYWMPHPAAPKEEARRDEESAHHIDMLGGES